MRPLRSQAPVMSFTLNESTRVPAVAGLRQREVAGETPDGRFVSATCQSVERRYVD
jgi:hypothetical protein